MAEKIIYVQNPHTSEISSHKVDIAELASFCGAGHDPNFSWRDDEAWAFVEANRIPSEQTETPNHIYTHFGARDPRISYTFSIAGAARELGIARQSFIERLERHPLEANGVHDGKRVYLLEDLLEWDKAIIAGWRPKKS